MSEFLRKQYRRELTCFPFDNKAALKSMKGQTITVKFALECLQTLNESEKHIEMNLICMVPGHSGTEGNGSADCLAKRGARRILIDLAPICSVPKTHIKRPDIAMARTEKKLKDKWRTAANKIV